MILKKVMLLAGASSGLQVPGLSSRLSRGDLLGTVAASVALTTPWSSGAAEPKSRDDDGYAVRKTDDQWRRELSRSSYYVLRRGATERPNSSPLVGEKREGEFLCAGCGAPLFASADKFNSGTGWPSFGAATSDVEVLPAAFEQLQGAELRCGRCGGHLGDRFLDGQLWPGTAAFKTGMRYCIDGAALVFVPADGSPPRRGDVDSEPPTDLPKWLRPPEVGNGASATASL
mmetsp:Transcript_2092/g.7093  ORF Transcript_2092/g.7093 Transcript_2092/m.7093 type:complete len:230 (+) Transcript_2092:1083-1772(+)